MRKQMPIIGISGKIGSGKTTLAEMLLAKLPSFVRCSYGDFLKREVAEKFNFPIGWCYSQEGKHNIVALPGVPMEKMSVRELLQWWGTDVCRKRDPDYWIKQMAKYLDTVCSTQIGGVIIDDVRFTGEADLVKWNGGILLRLNTYAGWKPEVDIAEHQSEVDLDGYGLFDMVFTPDFGRLHVVADDFLSNIDRVIARG